MMTSKLTVSSVFVLALCCACSAPASDAEEGSSAVSKDLAIVVENGETQPVYTYPDAIRETVFVEAAMDSDHDGKPDRIAVDIVRPKTDPGKKVAVIMEASPYYQMTPFADDTRLVPGSPLPLGHRKWSDEYFVTRGYASIEVEMQGTARSAGCPTTGGKEDTASIVAAVDWLNGRARGFTQEGTEVVADWSTGNVGMVGVSYNGTLPIAVAAQGTPGLKTIVPIAAISSWYDYARDYGIGYKGWESRYPEFLANAVASGTARTACADAIKKLGDDAGDDSFDYTSFWEERDYRKNLDAIRASVLVVHGLRDWNVKLHQFERFWSGLQQRGVPRKLWLHREAHTDPVRLRPDAWKATMHHWMDHWLYGLDNGVMAEPMTTIQRPDGTWEDHDSWPQIGGSEQIFHPTPVGMLSPSSDTARDGAEQTIVDDPSQNETSLISAPETQKPFRLAYVGAPLTDATRVSGTPKIRVTARFDAASAPLSAVLVDYGPATVESAEDLSIRELMNDSCSLQDLVNRTGCAAPRKPVVEATMQQIISRGSIDVKNRVSISQSKPLTAGETYQVEWTLHPVEYVFPAGHRIGLVVSANNSSYVAVDPLARNVSVILDGTSLTLPVAPR
jgi:X-Pro dipeptidyl-peptidase